MYDSARRCLLLCCLGTVLLFATMAHAADVRLAWDASNPATYVAGYTLHYGQATGVYTATVDAGLALQGTVTNLLPGVTYFFAATAYNAEGARSAYSNEVSYKVPLPVPGAPGELRIVITVTVGQ